MPEASHAKKLAIHLGGNEVDRMLARQNSAGLPAHTREIASGAIGCLGGSALSQEGDALVLTGVPINGPDLRQVTGAEAAARLLPQFDGAFTAVYWDARQQVLVVVTDCLGMQPLYMQRSDDSLRLVSETKALAGEPDLAAWGAFISIGHPIGNRSLLHGLERVPPASVLVYDCARRTLAMDRYWEWPEPSEAWRRYDFIDALEAEVRAYAASGPSGTLLLSGGFDSRLLLFLLKRAQVPVDALIVAHDDEYGDADGRLAERNARIAGVDHVKTVPPRDFFSSRDYLAYLEASDVGYPSLDLFIAKVVSHIHSDAVWDGLAPGFVFMPLHQPQGGFDAYLKQEIGGREGGAWRAAQTVFRPEILDQMHEGFSGDLNAAVAEVSRDAHGLARFVIENRSRNRASMNPLKVYANRTVPFTPGLSKDFVAHAATIPFSEKQRGEFYLRLFSQLDRRALATPFLSGGELLPAGRPSPGYYRERALVEFYRQVNRRPKLFSVMRRLGADHRPQRSVFLDDRLFEAGDDRWLNPDVRERLRAPGRNSYRAWKLLFHWKAWQWLHGQRLRRMLAREGDSEPNQECRS